MQVEEEVTIDYGADFFDTMQHQEEIKGLESKLEDTERQLKVALEALQAKDQQITGYGVAFSAAFHKTLHNQGEQARVSHQQAV